MRLHPGRRTAFRLGVAVALICILGMTEVNAAEWNEKQATRETMQVIFESLRYLLQIDVSNGDFDSPKNKAKILEALRELDDQAAILASHGFYDDPAGVFLAGVLERYSLLLLRGFERGEHERVQQFLYGITDICIACHTRLPSPRDSPVAKQFIDSQALWSLPLKRRAKMQIATRRFDDALNTLETLIESPKVADPVVLEEALRNYLIVNIRVKGDMERPIPVLEAIEERSTPHSAWRRDVEIWLESLQHFRDMPFIGDPLESARDTIDAAAKANFPSQRSALVEYIAASSLLHRYLVSAPSDVTHLSEAYYLLGVAEYRIYLDDWLPQAELYLEIAVVLAPDAPWARHAYSLLVEKIHRTYMQSPENRPPPEVEERLRELQEAIDGVQLPSASYEVTPKSPSLLVTAGHIVVCAGGGGIPVTLDTNGTMGGAQAVIDKDRASALLARELGADHLLLLTGEPVVWSAWPRLRGRAICSASPSSLQALSFESGTMGPKIEAACDFVRKTGKSAAIGALDDAVRIIDGDAGTAIRPSGELVFYAEIGTTDERNAL